MAFWSAAGRRRILLVRVFPVHAGGGPPDSRRRETGDHRPFVLEAAGVEDEIEDDDDGDNFRT